MKSEKKELLEIGVWAFFIAIPVTLGIIFGPTACRKPTTHGAPSAMTVEWDEPNGKRMIVFPKDDTELAAITADLSTRGIPYLANMGAPIEVRDIAAQHTSRFRDDDGLTLGITDRGHLSVGISPGVGMTTNGRIAVGGSGVFGGVELDWPPYLIK